MTGRLRKDLGFADGDAIYETLIGATNGLDDPEAMKVMAKLILLLANHIGDEETFRQALAAATKGPESGASPK